MNRFQSGVKSETLLKALSEEGYAIIDNMLEPKDVEELLAQIQPYSLLEHFAPKKENSFMGDRTVRFGRLLYRIPMTRSMVLNDEVIAVVRSILTENFPTFQLHFSGVMQVTEGAKAQVLHRDVCLFTNPSPSTVVATMWAAQDFTKENGATVLVPGSHQWPDNRKPDPSELVVAEMKAGSVLIYLGNVLHGAGACEKGTRTGVSLQYSVGWLRQEENQYLATPLNFVQEFPEELQRLIGYDLAARHWGYVDQQHPLDFLKDLQTTGGLNPEGYNFPGGYRGMTATLDEDLPSEFEFSVRVEKDEEAVG